MLVFSVFCMNFVNCEILHRKSVHFPCFYLVLQSFYILLHFEFHF